MIHKFEGRVFEGLLSSFQTYWYDLNCSFIRRTCRVSFLRKKLNWYDVDTHGIWSNFSYKKMLTSLIFKIYRCLNYMTKEPRWTFFFFYMPPLYVIYWDFVVVQSCWGVPLMIVGRHFWLFDFARVRSVCSRGMLTVYVTTWPVTYWVSPIRQVLRDWPVKSHLTKTFLTNSV